MDHNSQITAQENGKVDVMEKFKPTGAIAFFVVFILLDVLIWYGVYFLMRDRS